MSTLFAFLSTFRLRHNREPMPPGYLTVKEAAERLGVGDQRVRDLIKSKRLPAEKWAGVWIVREEDLRRVAKRDSKGGRGKKIVP